MSLNGLKYFKYKSKIHASFFEGTITGVTETNKNHVHKKLLTKEEYKAKMTRDREAVKNKRVRLNKVLSNPCICRGLYFAEYIQMYFSRV